MSFQDVYDDRIFRNGQVIGVNYGGSVHQPTVTYSNIPNLGAGRLPDTGLGYGGRRAPRHSGGDPNLGNTGAFMKLPYFGEPLNPTVMPYYPNQDYGGIELLAGAPRYIRGKFAPPGAIIKAPHIDSPYMDEQIRRGFAPMTPPMPRLTGPQLPGFV